MRKKFILLWGSVGLMGVVYWWGNDALLSIENSNPSKIIDQRLSEGKRLPVQGSNFKSYSRFWSLVGRTHVHGHVRAVILEAYHQLETFCPGVTFVYGETGWKNGGNFWPHKTHRQGLSVDFMVPVVDMDEGTPLVLPTYPWTLYDYHTRFDDSGTHPPYRIHFHALNEHLAALDQSCQSHGIKIKRVILDPALQQHLFQQPNSDKIKNIPFMKGKAWFPHDSHYHVDFEEGDKNQ